MPRNRPLLWIVISASLCAGCSDSTGPAADSAPADAIVLDGGDAGVDGPASDCVRPDALGTIIDEDTTICTGTYVFPSTPMKHGKFAFEQQVAALFTIETSGVTLTCQPDTILKLVHPDHEDLEGIDFSAAWNIPPKMTWEEKVACGNPADEWAGAEPNPCLAERSKWQAREAVSDYSHVGVYGKGVQNVTVKGCRFEGFKYGLYFVDASKLTLTENRFRDNYHFAKKIYLESLAPGETSWNGWVPFYPSKGWVITLGGDIFLGHVKDSVVDRNEGFWSANGLDCYFCENVRIEKNRFPDHSQTNIHLVNSSFNAIDSNDASFGTRTGAGGCSQSGCDSASFLLEEDSDFNVVRNNDFSFGGDGFFIRAVHHRCPDYTIVEGNDGSFSPHNAFENVFCVGNQFIDNKASYSYHGFWIGYSKSTLLKGNLVEHNYYGISAEHVVGAVIAGNKIADNIKHGIKLWTDDDMASLGIQPVVGFLVTDNDIKIGDSVILDGVADGKIFGPPALGPRVLLKQTLISNRNVELDFDGTAKPLVETLPFAASGSLAFLPQLPSPLPRGLPFTAGGPLHSRPELPSSLPRGVRHFHRPFVTGEPHLVLFSRPASLESLREVTVYPGDGQKLSLKPGDAALELTEESLGVVVRYDEAGRYQLFVVAEGESGLYTGNIEALAAPSAELFAANNADAVKVMSSNMLKVEAAHITDEGIQDPVVGRDFFSVAASGVSTAIELTLPPDEVADATGIGYWFMTTHQQVSLVRFYADMAAYQLCNKDPACLKQLDVFVALPLIELLDGEGKVLAKLKLRDMRHAYDGQFRWDYLEIPFDLQIEEGFFVEKSADYDPVKLRRVRWTVYKEYDDYSLSLDGVRLLKP